MIKIVDAIMGTGKSSAAVTYMNDHPEQKFVYITPYLDEARRIAEACPALNFKQPRRMAEHHGSKILHTAELIREGENVASTHAAFKSYTPEMLDDIRRHGYTLIADEVFDVLQNVDVCSDDVRVLMDAHRIRQRSDGSFETVGEIPQNGLFAQILRAMSEHTFYPIDGADGDTLFYWLLPKDLLLAFRDVFVLTYLFEGQDLRYYLDMEHVRYTYAGVEREGDTYRFRDGPSYIPDYARHLRDYIHILDRPKLNAVGDGRTALSMNWCRNNAEGVEELRKNLYNYFNHLSDGNAGERMWGSFVCAEHRLRGKGYSLGFIPFNERATNKYRDRSVLAYCANVFMNTGEKMFYTRRGVDVNEDVYALSVMVQWIWRSAIRDGKEIQLYVPSQRMRDLLTDWMDRLAA